MAEVGEDNICFETDYPHVSATPVVVVTGAGGMGQAVVRRLGSGRSVVLADFDTVHLATTAETLHRDGYAVHPVPTDVSDPGAVAAVRNPGGQGLG